MDNQCHCCLQRPSARDLRKPFTHLGITESYSVMFEECFAIHLIIDSDGEHGICLECVDQLRGACHFKLQVLQCQADLQERWGWQQHVKDELLGPGAAAGGGASDYEDSPLHNADDPMDHDEVFEELSTQESLVKQEPTTVGEPELLDEMLGPGAAAGGGASDNEDSPLHDADDPMDHDEVLEKLSTQESLVKQEPATVDEPEFLDEMLGPGAAAGGGASDNEDSPLHDANDPMDHDEVFEKLSTQESLVKQEPTTVDEPELLGTMPADRDSIQDPHLALKDCTVRLERIPYNTLLARTERTSEVEDIDQCEVNAPPPAARAARAAPACPARRERCDAVPTDTRQETNKRIQHTYVCDTCGKAFDEKVVLVRHIRAHAQEKYSKKSKFDTSKGSKTNKLYSREICNEQFSKMHNVIEHKLIHSGKKRYSCDICRKQFARKDSLPNHLLIHTGQKPYCCEICKERFSQKGSLMRHKAFIHRDMISEDEWHMRTMKVMCTICNKPFVNLKRHIVIHTGDKPYFCDICQKQFTHKNNMTEHKRIHTGERPYCCTVCSKTFRKNSHLYRHERLHTGKKPYSCEICKKKFGRADNMLNHKRVHLKPMKNRGRSRKTNLDQVNDDDDLPDASADGDILTKSIRKSISVSYDTGPTEG